MATLNCTESPGGSTGPERRWPLTCPAGTVPVAPSLSYAPAPGSTINFSPSGGLVGTTAAAQIRVTPAGGSAGNGAAVTTRFEDCAISNESVAGTFSGFQNALTFVGSSTTPQNLNLVAQVRATAVTGTLTCRETRAGESAMPHSWQLQVAAGVRPSRLEITKSVSAPQVTTDSEFSYTIEVTNAGSSTESSIVVLDDVPETLTVLSASGAGWNCSMVGNLVDCRRSSLVPNTASSFQIAVRAPSTPRTIVNSARATSQATQAPIRASVSVDIVAPPPTVVDLRIDKRDSTDPVLAGSNFSYFLEVANIGANAASGVVVSDSLPAGVTLVAASGAGWSCSGTTSVSCSLAGSLAAGATATVELQVRAPAQATALTNTANVASSEVDANSSNNSDSETTTVNDILPVDLRIDKRDSADPVLAGGSFSYFLDVANIGSNPATGVVVSDSLPAGITLVAASGAGWSCSGTMSVSCSLAGTLASGAVSTVELQVRAPAQATTLTNSANVSAAGVDVNPGNNSDSETTTVNDNPPPAVDLRIDKRDSSDPVLAGSNFSYFLEVANIGANAATGVVVSDSLPAGVTLVAASGAGWSCSGTTTVSCSRAALAAGAASTIELQVRAPAQATALTNSANVSSAGVDANPNNNSDTETTAVTDNLPVDLRIDKRDSADPVLAGSSFSYFLEVANIGANAATGVVVSDSLPAGVTLVAASGAGWTCTGRTTVNCSLGGLLAAGAASTIELQVRAPAQAGALTNTASVGSSGVDINANNNSDSETTTVNDPPPPEPRADLSISAQAVPASALTGQAVELRLAINNRGPDAATTTTVTGTLSAAFSVGSAAGSGWTCNVTGQQVQCTRPATAVNASSEIRVQTTLRAGATASAEANFTVSSPIADPVSADNSARVVVAYQPGGADLAIVKIDSVDPVTAAAQFNYTLTVSNAGPEAATGVRVSDALPAALTFVSASGSGFTCSRAGQTVNCDLAGSLAVGSAAVVTIAVRAPTTAQSISNEGVVSSSTTDRNPANNRSTQATQISARTAADLAALLDDAVVDPASAAALPVVASECAVATSALAAACRGIIDSADQGRTSEVTEALRAIAPDEVLAQTLLMREIGATQFFNVDARLNELRRGGGGFSLAGLTVNHGGQSIPLALVGEALQSALGFGEDYGLVSPWGFFINGNFTSGDQNQNVDDGRVGVDYDSIGMTAGVDYRLSPRSVVGAAIGYADLSSDVSGGSTLDAKSLSFTGYGSWYINERLYVDSRLTYGSVDFDQSRRIFFRTGATVFDEIATGATDGTQFTLATSIGYHLNYGAWSVTPNAGLRYISNDVDGFDESGAGAFNVGYDEQSFSTLQYGVGVQVARALSLTRGVLMPQFDFSLNGENSDDPEAQARLLNGSTGQVFRLQEENLDSSYGTAGLGFVYLMSSGKQAFMYYRTNFGNDDLDRGTLNLGGRFEF